ncbi:MAG: MarR family transcriptional regulator [Cytophagales bacterium]|nr:MarR family transcriptional regulator [Cytophagales bacterium]MDW8384247.1 MarR family transcriptional regulator [Flammeovirgaceae bacterium]
MNTEKTMNVTYNRKESLGFLLSIVFRVTHNALQQRFNLENIDLTVDMWLILNSLHQKNGQNQQQISADIQKDKSSVTRILDNLAKRGLIQRTDDSKDRRNKIIHLTDSGRALIQRILPLVIEDNRFIEAHFSEDELKSCKRLLQQIYERCNHFIKESKFILEQRSKA